MAIATIDQFMQALGMQESGNYNAPPHDDVGYWNLGGAYQILQQNWSQWAQNAGLSADAEYSAANQETVARWVVQHYYDAYGDWAAVAAAWNGGPGGAESYQNYGQNSYMVTNGYVPSVMSKLSAILGGSVNPLEVPQAPE